MLTGIRIFPALGLLVCLAASGSATAEVLGAIPDGGFNSPEGDARFSRENGARPLNNLVFELLSKASPGIDRHDFQNPREGWIFIRVTASAGHPSAAVLLDGKAVALKRVAGTLEAMRYVPEGPHTVQLPADAGPAERLEVRAVGELFYATYGLNPHIEETGKYTWEFLREHCLDHYNSMIGATTLVADGTSIHEAELREWTAEGKRWFTVAAVPYDVTTVDEAYARWADTPGMRHPLMSGIWADEFGVGEKFGKRTADMYRIWLDALRKMRANSEFASRVFYAYGPYRLLPADRFEEMYPFIQTLMESDYRLGPEWYLPESSSRPGREIVETGDLIAEFSPAWEQASRASFEAASPGAASNRVVVVSLLSEPGWETGDLYPGYDYNVFLDSQLQFIATDPAFFGVRGLQGYLSSYCSEEQTRLFAQLIRHYALEGNTERFLSDPYVLRHIRNPDLAAGAEGWTLRPAVSEPGRESITIKNVPGFGTLQAKYHAPEGTGDTAFWTRRNRDKPNIMEQSISGLTPGRCYTLRLITGDFQEFTSGTSVRRKHAVSVAVGDAERVEEKSFQAVVQSGYWHSYGAFNAANPYWLNYHQYVFRAQAETAHLRLSDWGAESSPGGPVDEELIWNFFQIQPYFE